MYRRSFVLGSVAWAGTGVGIAADWSRFLGSDGTLRGLDQVETPTEWSGGENLKWQTDLPGKGVSSPIVVGDRVFVTCYSGYGVGGENERLEDLQRHLVCVHRGDGRVLWAQTVESSVPEDPYTGIGVPAHGYASHTPVSDGESVFVFYGKSGVLAYDFNGNERWRVSVGTDSGSQRWGSAASPIVYENLVIINAAEESESLIALDKKSGQEVWRSEAESLQGGWSTPAVVKAGEQQDLVLMVPGEVWGLNPETGKLRWFSRGLSDSTACSSIVPGDGVVYAIGGRGGEAVSVRVGGRGDVNESHVVWDGNIPGRFSTPVLHEGHLYCYSGNVLSVHDAATGERVNQRRLSADVDRGGPPARPAGFGQQDGPGQQGNPGQQGGFGQQGASGQQGGDPRRGGRRGGMGDSDYASPVLAGGKIYITGRGGSVFVVAANPEVELLATNRFEGDTGFGGTPAVSDGELFFRSDRRLYCVSGTPKTEGASN